MKNNSKIIIILVGIPHSGKTTFSKYLQEKYNYKIVSTDNIKRRIYKDSKYNVKHLFEIQKIELETLMKKNCLIVADSNNSKKTYRMI